MRKGLTLRDFRKLCKQLHARYNRGIHTKYTLIAYERELNSLYRRFLDYGVKFSSDGFYYFEVSSFKNQYRKYNFHVYECDTSELLPIEDLINSYDEEDFKVFDFEKYTLEPMQPITCVMGDDIFKEMMAEYTKEILAKFDAELVSAARANENYHAGNYHAETRRITREYRVEDQAQFSKNILDELSED